MQLLAIDLGKRSFHIHGITDDGEVISKKVSRAKLEAAVLELAPESLAMEACRANGLPFSFSQAACINNRREASRSV